MNTLQILALNLRFSVLAMYMQYIVFSRELTCLTAVIIVK